jgi:FG-GAP-like repeat
VNGDSKIDLVVGNGNSSSGNLAVLLGDGTAHFAAATTFLSGNPINSVAVVDFDGDSKLDIVANSSANGKIFSMRGDGSGSFTNINTLDLSAVGPGAVRVADFNGDSKPDLAVDISPVSFSSVSGMAPALSRPPQTISTLGLVSRLVAVRS